MAKVIEISKVKEQLQSYIQSGNLNFLLGSGASLPAIKLAGSIEKEINELLTADKTEDANLLALSFIEGLEEQHGTTLKEEKKKKYDKTLDNYKSFIRVLDELLFERKNHLLPRQANIFTTNYDLFTEIAASDLPSLVINDGFDRSSSISLEFKLAPEQYHDRIYRSGTIYSRQTEVPVINLFKVHGSLNWKKNNADIVLRTDAIDRLTDEDKKDTVKVEKSLDDRVLILPNLRKFNSTLIDRVYYDMLRVYANSIEKENAVLISLGFSFEDEHILDITRRSLRNPTSQLIVFSHSIEGVDRYKELFSNQNNALIVHPEGDEKIQFPEFSSQLKKIIPEKV